MEDYLRGGGSSGSGGPASRVVGEISSFSHHLAAFLQYATAASHTSPDIEKAQGEHHII